MANRPIPAPLPGDLPENWTAGQTVAPTGPEAGLSQQHGYNYQSKQINDAQKAVNELNAGFDGLVPDTRKVNGKPLSGDITLAASDVGADPAGSAATVQSNLTTHTGDMVKHITSTERTTWGGKEAALSGAASKTSLVSADMMVITDSAASNATKRITWTNVIAAIKAALDTVYAAVSHTHGNITNDGKIGSAADLPVFTGTGGAVVTKTAAAARAALAALAAFAPTSITVSATWTGAGPWTQSIAVSGVLAAWDWRLGLHLSKITDDAARKLQEKAFACITWVETYDGGITLTCRDKKPDVAISAILAGEV